MCKSMRQINVVLFPVKAKQSIRLTYNLKGDGCFVFKAFHFQCHLVNARVLPLSTADEHDAVPVAVPDVDPLGVQRLSILQP